MPKPGQAKSQAAPRKTRNRPSQTKASQAEPAVNNNAGPPVELDKLLRCQGSLLPTEIDLIKGVQEEVQNSR